MARPVRHRRLHCLTTSDILAVEHSDPLLSARLLDFLASFVEILFVLLVLLAELIKLEDSVQRIWLLLFVAAAIRTIVIAFAANCRLFELILPLRLPNFILNLSECVTGLQLRYESL